MTHNVSGTAARSADYDAERIRDSRPSDGYGGDAFGNTRMYSARAGAYYDFVKAKRKADGDSDQKESPKMSSKGRAKFGEARKEAGERRRFVERRRGALLAVIILLMSCLILLAIYKLVFVVRDVSVVGGGVYSTDELLEASGIGKGVNLYSFRASAVEKSITLNCPYVSEVEVDRRMPNNVVITVTEDKPAYYAEIFGEIKLLSSGLRVLDTVAADEDIPEGLIKLKLPSVTYSVAGRVVEFANPKRDRGIREVLATVADSNVVERLTVIDLRDQFDISMVCDGKFKLVCGDSEKLSYKLKTASKVLEDAMFATDNKIRIDLTTDGKTGVMIDNLMELE